MLQASPSSASDCRGVSQHEAAWLPAGGLISCADDMLLWLTFLLDHTTLPTQGGCFPVNPSEGLSDSDNAKGLGLKRGRVRRIMREILRARVKADWQLIFGVSDPGGAAFPEFPGVEYALGIQVFSYRYECLHFGQARAEAEKCEEGSPLRAIQAAFPVLVLCFCGRLAAGRPIALQYMSTPM